MRNWTPAVPFAAALGFSAAVFDRLPAEVRPDLNGLLPVSIPDQDVAFTRTAAAWLLPVIAALVWALLAGLARFAAPRRPFPDWLANEATDARAIARFASTYNTIIFAIVSGLALLHIAALGTVIGWPAWTLRAFTAAIGVLMLTVGNVIPRARPNWIVGIRTKGTLASAEVWMRTHRLLGAMLMIVGLLVICASVFSAKYALVMAGAGGFASLVASHAIGMRRGPGVPPVVAVLVLLALLTGACSPSTGPGPGPPAKTLAEFEAQLDRLRSQLAIPGMSAIVMMDDAVLWEGSLGVADIGSQRPVTPATQYHIASLTKTFASTLVMQLVEQGLLSLDDPISSYGVTLPGTGVIRVRHLLSHTSEGVPGDEFRYNGDRFALLDQVIRRVTGESFATRVMDRIVTPLDLQQTAHNPLDAASFAASGRDLATYVAGMATGYGVDSRGRAVPVAYPSLFSSAAGLVSTAREVARYSTALDAGQFLSAGTRTLMYTPARGAGNRILPHGLGWFISTQDGHTLVWHYGYWTGNSSLIIKEPSRRLTFVVLTNSDQLSARFKLGAGDLMSSTVAQAFVNAFVTGSLGSEP